MALDLDDGYRRLLLDETKLRAGKTKKEKTEEKKEGKKRKHKKKHMPKHADTASPPDPERWLPKWKRSKYRKQFKRYGKFRETQGEATTTVPIGGCKIR